VRDRYIGLCVGPPGVGKTFSARRHARWDLVESCFPRFAYDEDPPPEAARMNAVFYTPAVVANPKQIEAEVRAARNRLGWLVDRALAAEEEELSDDDGRTQTRRERHNAVGPNHARLLIVDEANRLKPSGLEQLRDMYDREGFGLVLVGMPGLEKTLARYPQLYSRVGFVHRFGPLGPKETKEVVEEHRRKLGIGLPKSAFSDEEALAAIVRTTGGNFRLVQRLLQQIERLVRINGDEVVDVDLVEAARESLVIGIA
jgi:DNA transposition AAA+ family ATPase